MSLDPNNDLSQALRQLVVSAPALDRDRLLFEAGRRSVKPTWGWPFVTVASLLLACSMSLFAWWPQLVTERIVHVPPVEPSSSPVVMQAPNNALGPWDDAVSYVMLRQEMFTGTPRHHSPDISPGKPTPMLTAGSFLQQTP